MQVLDPDGVTWRVRRRWDLLPRRDGFPTALVAAVVVVVLAVPLLFGVPVLAVLSDLAVVVAAGVMGTLWRLHYRRPWTVEAVSATGERREVTVSGFRRTAPAVRSLAAAIEAGRPPAG